MGVRAGPFLQRSGEEATPVIYSIGAVNVRLNLPDLLHSRNLNTVGTIRLRMFVHLFDATLMWLIGYCAKKDYLYVRSDELRHPGGNGRGNCGDCGMSGRVVAGRRRTRMC